MTDILKSMDDTLELARAQGLDALFDDRIPIAMRYAHLAGMRRRYVEAQASAKPLHDLKANRWLGWMQASVMGLSAIRHILGGEPGMELEDFKAINRQN